MNTTLEAIHRVQIKRKLRKMGLPVNNEAPTSELIQTLQAIAPESQELSIEYAKELYRKRFQMEP